ncbi:MAG: hypothetical protein AAF192_15960, partial [Pseudomonadota bacterium]
GRRGRAGPPPSLRAGLAAVRRAAPPAAMAASAALGLLLGYGAPEAWIDAGLLSLPEDPALDLALLAADLIDGAGTRP